MLFCASLLLLLQGSGSHDEDPDQTTICYAEDYEELKDAVEVRARGKGRGRGRPSLSLHEEVEVGHWGPPDRIVY